MDPGNRLRMHIQIIRYAELTNEYLETNVLPEILQVLQSKRTQEVAPEVLDRFVVLAAHHCHSIIGAPPPGILERLRHAGTM